MVESIKNPKRIQVIPLLGVQNLVIPHPSISGQIPYWMWVMHWNSPGAGECLRNKQASKHTDGRLGHGMGGVPFNILLNHHGVSSKGCHVHTFSTSRIDWKKRRYKFQIPFLGGKPWKTYVQCHPTIWEHKTLAGNTLYERRNSFFLLLDKVNFHCYRWWTISYTSWYAKRHIHLFTLYTFSISQLVHPIFFHRQYVTNIQSIKKEKPSTPHLTKLS